MLLHFYYVQDRRKVGRFAAVCRDSKKKDGEQDEAQGPVLQLLQITWLVLQCLSSFEGSVILSCERASTGPSIINADLVLHLLSCQLLSVERGRFLPSHASRHKIWLHISLSLLASVQTTLVVIKQAISFLSCRLTMLHGKKYKKGLFYGFYIYCLLSYLIIVLWWNDRHTIGFLLPVVKKCFKLTFSWSQWFNINTFLAFSWQILLIIASVIGVIVYRLSVFLVFSATLSQHISEKEAIRKYLTPQTATSVTASLISFIVIMVLNVIYEKVAILITDFGMLLLLSLR